MFDYYHGRGHLRRVCFKGELRRYARCRSPPGRGRLAGVITAEQTPSATRPRPAEAVRGRVSSTALIMLVPVLVVALVLGGSTRS